MPHFKWGDQGQAVTSIGPTGKYRRYTNLQTKIGKIFKNRRFSHVASQAGMGKFGTSRLGAGFEW
jgi:hypothetical protein